MASAAPPTQATESKAVTCDECVFRQLLLCAIPGNAACPTFRPAATAELLTPHPQPPPHHLTAVAAA